MSAPDLPILADLSDTAVQAAEEAYDSVIRTEGLRSPYLNTRAFRAAFKAAVETLSRARGEEVGNG